eukprot:TRINITY_DN12022_c1_g1_i6.p1 TRINITY_DN12022_c1_g1~~TRINITY_DN12022_c1_g1_i6.p1  ORF type:complete len:128 (+),score=18.85 TRINITY_DN12022_c1_g1_i6:36-419(+)
MSNALSQSRCLLCMHKCMSKLRHLTSSDADNYLAYNRLAFAYWFGEGILRDMSVLPPQSSPSWFALPLLIMIINKYMMDYIIVHPLVSQVPFGLVIAFMWMRWMLDVAAGAWFVTRVVTPDNDNRRQ